MIMSAGANVALAIWLVATATSAIAQKPMGDSPLVGTWSGEMPGQGGLTHGSDQYNRDGSYVSVMQLANGSVQRIYGTYRTQQIEPGVLQVNFTVQGFLPRQICAQAPGFPMRCRPNEVPSTIQGRIDFASPNSFRINGVTMRRDASTRLLELQVPSQLVLAAPAPVRPYIRQPVAPGAPTHYTPRGPGSVGAITQDDQTQQYRICAVNNRTIVHEQDGSVQCVSP